MPPNTVKIDRSTKWGNPFKVGEWSAHPTTGKRILVATKEEAIALFAEQLKTGVGTELASAARVELKGKNLACWCARGSGCHGDILLQVANAPGAFKRAA